MTVLAVVVVAVACLAVLDRQQCRHAVERARDRALLDRLAERVQKPDMVAAPLDAEPTDRALFVSPFDDDGFNDLQTEG